MNLDRLRDDLAGLAEEVMPVDLHGRALKTSRRLGIQRALASSASALVMLGAAAGTAYTLLPRDDSGPAPAATSSASVSPPLEQTPTPEPSASASASQRPTAKPAASLAGTLYYLGRRGHASVIHALGRGTDRVVATVSDADGSCVYNSITVAPDGKHLAWVRGGADTGTGTLVTAAIDGSHARDLLTGVTCLGSKAIAWVGGDRLMVYQGSRPVLVDMATGTPVLGDPGQQTDMVWSADGGQMAARDEDGPFVIRYDGGEPRRYTFAPPAEAAKKWDGWAVRGVSMSGRYVSVGWNGTDTSRQTGSWAVVDTTTSRVVKLPVAGEVSSIHFPANGQVLARQSGGLVLFDANLKKLSEVAEPSGLRSLPLLTYVR